MNLLNVMPWWGWLLCGVGTLILSRVVGWVADDTGSAPVEILRWVAVFAGAICLVIGIALLVF
jgi:hypothetical protein